MSNEKRELAWNAVVTAARGFAAEADNGLDQTIEAALITLDGCVPVDREEYARLRRALWIAASQYAQLVDENARLRAELAARTGDTMHKKGPKG